MVDANRTEIARFERRNIRVINLPGKKEHYPDILKDFFIEIKELITQNSTQLFQTTDNKLKEELILPDEINRLCYIAAPHQKMAQLKENIFPLLSNYSITPITLDEILYPSDNWLVKSELLIQKTNLALVDLTHNNPNVMWELTTLLKNDKYLILIAKENSIINIQIKEQPIIYYKTIDDEDFLIKLQKCINEYLKNYPFDGIEESTRLFNKKEYNAAAISAFRYLEESIRRFDIKLESHPQHYSFSMMLQTLYKQKIIQNTSLEEIREYIFLRNKLVHTDITINKSLASNVITFVQNIINEITSYINEH